ncbi:DUF3037 domain-containing protein [Klebsiella pneumoniae]|uniref:DUF3037 domain-containing protein n=2 Tax=Klebsiella pneumoniae TaxID=573 RepID=UPI000F61BA2A|nr:DUF3037 domain-containing protein [Klebsiella pneumoniae]RRF16247.1 DUF3037 domain-containing protein [Klebsiella pneumoniae]HCI4395301.1 DUF3037 domain-containing protein [Klebsiella pneumoniae]
MTTPCLYSIVRYAPYAETEEFANIGVVMCAPKENFFDFQITKRNDSRVRSFFHDDCIFPVAKDTIQRELQFAKAQASQIVGHQQLAQFFRYFTSKKESIFQFSSTRVVLSADPKEELEHIYNRYVNHSDYTKERREDVLAREIKRSIDRIDGLKNAFKPESIDGFYAKFTMPLVAKKQNIIQCAIKPLAFTQSEPGKMMEHSDTWVMRITRAAEENLLATEDILFTLEIPDSPSSGQRKVIDTIKRTMDAKKINHTSADNHNETINFAKKILAHP